MKKLVVVVLFFFVGCTYAPHYTQITYTYKNYSPKYTKISRTDEWAKDMQELREEMKRGKAAKKKIKKTTRYIYGVKK